MRRRRARGEGRGRGGLAARSACAVAVFSALSAFSALSCSSPPVDPLQLDRNLLRVSNRTGTDWTHVEIWLNTYYRVTAPVIPAHTTFSAPLDTFVAGYGQRFDFRRMQVKDLRLSAKTPDGAAVDLKKQFDEGGVKALVGAFGGKR